MLMRLMSKSEFLIVPKGTKFAGPGKLGLNWVHYQWDFELKSITCATDRGKCQSNTIKF